jgi:hypothetical protein
MRNSILKYSSMQQSALSAYASVTRPVVGASTWLSGGVIGVPARLHDDRGDLLI